MMEIKIKYHLIYILILLFVTIGVYFNSLQNSFAYDDEVTVELNDFIKEWGNAPKILTQDYFSLSGEATYRPLVTLSYFLDFSIWQLNPFGYHLTNLLFHIANVILIYCLLCVGVRPHQSSNRGQTPLDMGSDPAASDPTFYRTIPLFTALLFAAHPIQTEAVVAISFREDLMAMCFFLLSLLLYIKKDDYKGLKKNSCYFAALFTFTLALFSKEMAVTLPLVIILYDLYFTQDKDKAKVIYRQRGYYLGFFLILAFYLFVRFFIFVCPSGSSDYLGGSIYLTFLTMFKVFTLYIKLLLLPINLCADYVVKVSSSPFELLVAVGMGLLIILLIISFKLYKWERSPELESSKLISFAILYFFLTLLPVSNIVPLGRAMAERFLYIPSLGFCIVLGVILAKISQLKIKRVPVQFLKSASILSLILILLFYSITTINRNKVWANNLVLWEETVKNSPESSIAHYNLGNEYRKKKVYGRAIKEYKYAITLKSDHVEALNNLGLLYTEERLYNQAIDNFRKAIKMNPNVAEFYNGLGLAYYKKGLLNKAIDNWKMAVKINPNLIEAHRNLGFIYNQLGMREKAVVEYKKIMKLEE